VKFVTKEIPLTEPAILASMRIPTVFRMGVLRSGMISLLSNTLEFATVVVMTGVTMAGLAPINVMIFKIDVSNVVMLISVNAQVTLISMKTFSNSFQDMLKRFGIAVNGIRKLLMCLAEFMVAQFVSNPPTFSN
jgi:hypothetical protein